MNPWLMLSCILVLSGCAEPINTPVPGSSEQEIVAQLPDGVAINTWQTVYQLDDGTDLLYVQNIGGPSNSSVIGRESFDDLNPTAQQAVLNFYEDLELPADLLQTELKKAYETYQSRADAEFEPVYIDYDTVAVSSNEYMMCFDTTVSAPVRPGEKHNFHLGTVFHRDTGEVWAPRDYFTCAEADMASELLMRAGLPKDTPIEEMKAAWKPEYVTLFPDSLQVWFPKGSLPSQEHAYGFSIEYKDLDGMIDPRVIPTPTDGI